VRVEPDHLRWCAERQAEDLKVGVERNERSLLRLCEGPDCGIGDPGASCAADVLYVGECDSNARGDRLGEVLIQQEADRTDSRCGVDQQTALALSGEGEALEHILVGELRELGEELRLRRTGREVAKDLANRQPGALHAGLAKADLGID